MCLPLLALLVLPVPSLASDTSDASDASVSALAKVDPFWLAMVRIEKKSHDIVILYRESTESVDFQLKECFDIQQLQQTDPGAAEQAWQDLAADALANAMNIGRLRDARNVAFHNATEALLKFKLRWYGLNRSRLTSAIRRFRTARGEYFNALSYLSNAAQWITTRDCDGAVEIFTMADPDFRSGDRNFLRGDELLDRIWKDRKKWVTPPG